MKKILVAVFAVALLAGCATISSIYNGARPNKVVENRDGTITFEFLFPAKGIDSKMALQRMDEYLAGYASDNGFSGYDQISFDVSVVETTNGGSVVAAAFGTWGSDLSGSGRTYQASQDQYLRALVQLKFKA
jgi:hypothetical protein